MSVKCPKCQSNNPETATFCADCGTKIISPKDIDVTETIETPREELTRGTLFADRYEIIEELGKGGMGNVYRVEDTKTKEEIALKLIKPEISSDKKTIERFRNELITARKIRDKNVCGMYDLGEYEGDHFITMEYVPGEDLKSLIRRVRIDIGTAIKIAIQVCEGLAEAHKLGIVHRDLKPSNIMIDKEGNARIMDFGIARSLEAKGITGEGVMIGTPEYMSPEQVEGKEVDQRSDIYSLGVILYEMVTGRVPFEGDTPFTIGMKHKGEIPQNPKELNAQIPGDLNRVILRCLEKDKEKRYQSAGEVRSELANIEKGIPTTERVVPERKPITSKEITVTFGLKKLFIPAFIVLAIVIVAVVIWQLLQQKEAVHVAIGGNSIAVLPFADLSPQKDQEHFCDGMSETIIAKLSSIKELKVIPRTSVIRYKDTEKNIKDIGQELGVSTILEGSIQKEEDNIRLIAKLTNVEDGFQLWSETYDRRLESVFAIQSDIADKITRALKMELSPEEKELLEKKPTGSLKAYDYYLKGREYYRRYQKQDNEQAIKLFKKALEVDKDYALAYAGLGDAYAQGEIRFGSLPTGLDLAIDASQTAISIDPNCAEAHKALGLTYFYKGWLRKAINVNRKAIEIYPNLDTAIINLAISYLFIGEFEKGIPLAKKALALTPSDPWPYHTFALVYYFLDDLAKAEQWLKKSLELKPDFIESNGLLILSNLGQGKINKAVEYSQKLLLMLPRDIFAIIWAGEAALFAGDIPQAKQYYQKAVELSPGHVNWLIGIRNLTRLGYIYWISGDSVEAQKLFIRSLSLDQKQIEQGNEWWMLRNDMAAIYAVQGNKNEAYKWLKKSIEAGCRNFRFAQIEPMLENLRNDKNFKQMMAEVKGLVDEMRERIEKKD